MLRNALVAMSLGTLTACAWPGEFGPTYKEANAIANPHCTEPLLSLPGTIAVDVHAVRFTGAWGEDVATELLAPRRKDSAANHRRDDVVPYLFGEVAYAYVERDVAHPPPDGTRLIRYAAAGESRIAGHGPLTCPDGTEDLGSWAETWENPAGRPRACATTRGLAEPTTRFQVRRTIVHSSHGHFRRRIVTDEIVDAHQDTVLGHARRVEVRTSRTTAAALMVGFFPVLGGTYKAGQTCGRTLTASDVMKVLAPPTRRPAR